MHWDLSTFILAASGLVLVVAGIGLILANSRLYRKLQVVMERPRRVERFIYRHHRPIGVIFIAGALAFLMLLARYHGQVIESRYWHASTAVQLTWLVAWLFAAFALIIGIYIGIRPSALKGFEALANRWIEPIPRLIPRAPKPAGLLLLLAGISCLLAAAKLAAA